MKKITICDKEYDISCNAYTRVQYKSLFGRGIFADIKSLSTFANKQTQIANELLKQGKSEEEIEKAINLELMEDVDELIDVLERIAYILIYTADSKVGSFEDWLKTIDKIDLSADWVSEVTELAVSSFC